MLAIAHHGGPTVGLGFYFPASGKYLSCSVPQCLVFPKVLMS